jgi:hypothetical protein
LEEAIATARESLESKRALRSFEKLMAQPWLAGLSHLKYLITAVAGKLLIKSVFH